MSARVFFKLVFPALLCLAAACSCNEPSEPVPETPSLSVPADVAVSSVTTETASFRWDAVQGAEQYYTRLQTEDGKIAPGGQKNTEVPEVSFSGLKDGTTYKFQVKAVNARAESAYSAAVSVTTEKAPEPDPEPEPEPGPGPGPEALYAEFLIPGVEEADGSARAFPGAEGGGMYTTGGRGGRVIHVTNLNDSGDGSLRAAVEASGKRIVVFDVAGLIELQKPLVISKGDITIAGQTAPGDGICIKNYTTQVKCDNVIIRFVRFRLGDEGPNAGDGEDATWGRYQKNIILDHCSMSWSIDECASYYGNRNMTMQWCILTESLNNSIHSKGAHGYGGIWGGINASFHHNLLSNHHSRNPRIDHPEVYGEYISSNRGEVDLRNNIIYNWGDNSCYGGEGGAFNWVNCYYKPGPDSKDRKYFVQATAIYSGQTDYGYPYMYLSGNVHTKYPDITADNTAGIRWYDEDKSSKEGRVLAEALKIKGPSGETVWTTTHSAEDALEVVLAGGGASLRRDAVDLRAVEQVRNNSGKIISRQDDVGGWPVYSASDEEIAASADSDRDGMPDAFEEKFGLDGSDPSDATALTLDIKGRYTNLEMYLHYLVRDIVAAQNAGGEYVAN